MVLGNVGLLMWRICFTESSQFWLTICPLLQITWCSYAAIWIVCCHPVSLWFLELRLNALHCLSQLTGCHALPIDWFWQFATLIAKTLRGKFFSFLDSGDVDKDRSVCWLKYHLYSELESTIIAVQDQVITTRVYECKIMHKSVLCRVCGQVEETILHLLSACPMLASTAYMYRHNLIVLVVHWYLSKQFSLLGVLKDMVLTIR